MISYFQVFIKNLNLTSSRKLKYLPSSTLLTFSEFNKQKEPKDEENQVDQTSNLNRGGNSSMSHSTILIQGSPSFSSSSITAGNCRKQTRNIVCCCPWSSSESKNKRYANSSSSQNSSIDLAKHAVISCKRDPGNKNPLFISVFLLPFNFITFLLSFSFFSLMVKGWRKVKASGPKRAQRLPPGPPKLPMIGHLNHIISPLPHHHPLRDLAKKYGPLMHLKFGEVSAVIVSSPEFAKQVLKTHDLACADRPKSVALQTMWYNYKDVVFCPYGDYWRQMRKICIVELLSPKNVRSFDYIRKDEALVFIEFMKSTCGVPFNVTERIFMFMGSMTCRAAFGKVSTDRGEAIKLITKAISLAGQFDLADLFPSMKIFDFISWNKFKLLKLRGKLDVILDNIIDEHKENLAAKKTGNGEMGTEDLVDILLRLMETGKLDFQMNSDNIKSIIFDIFAAGTESSSSTVDWTMAELMRKPSVMAKAQEEIRQTFNGKKTITDTDIHELKYLKMVINETLRLHPPVAMVPRASREEFEIDGYDVPKNVNIIVNIWSIGRDPNYWQNPEIFEPERFDGNPIDFLGTHFEYIPFGSGRRICPGMMFGLSNVEYLLAHLLYYFDWKLPEGIRADDIDMTEVGGFVVSRKNSLYLIATPYI